MLCGIYISDFDIYHGDFDRYMYIDDFGDF